MVFQNKVLKGALFDALSSTCFQEVSTKEISSCTNTFCFEVTFPESVNSADSFASLAIWIICGAPQVSAARHTTSSRSRCLLHLTASDSLSYSMLRYTSVVSTMMSALSLLTLTSPVSRPTRQAQSRAHCKPKHTRTHIQIMREVEK